MRQDSNVLVLTEHTDRIHPRDLSDNLSARVGKDKFKISLRKNIYIIYVDIRKRKHDEVSKAAKLVDATDQDNQNRDSGSDDEEIQEFSIGPKTHQQRLLDIKSAEQILSEAKSPHYWAHNHETKELNQDSDSAID